MQDKQRILTGDRPTGRLHLGHYVGSLKNRVKLQYDYETFILIADVQALTTHFDKPALIKDSIFQVAVDNLSAGLDPSAVTFIQQSQIPAIAELTVLFSLLVSVNTLRHNPTVKSEAAQYGYQDLSYGFLGYPVSQAADIIFCRADLVPVGDDQLPHLELARKIVRRFNELYSAGLKEPKELLGPIPRLKGLDGSSKMGKSRGNAIFLSDSDETVAEKITAAKTDPARVHKNDPGHPDICTIYSYHQAFNAERHEEIFEDCKRGAVGCRDCKRHLTSCLNRQLLPIREKRRHYEANLHIVRELIMEGSKKARLIGDETVCRLKQAMSLDLENMN